MNHLHGGHEKQNIIGTVSNSLHAFFQRRGFNISSMTIYEYHTESGDASTESAFRWRGADLVAQFNLNSMIWIQVSRRHES